MRDEILQEQRCAVCGGRLLPVQAPEADEVRPHLLEDDVGDRPVCATCDTQSRYFDGFRSDR